MLYKDKKILISYPFYSNCFISSVQLPSCVWLCDPMECSTPGFPVHHQHQSLLKLMSIESVMPSNHLVLCCLLLPHLQSFPASRSFQWISSSHQVAKLLAKVFSFSMSPSSEYSGLIPFRMDWLDLLVDLGTLKSLLQHHSSKASILWRSAFFMVQLYSHTHTWLLEKP